MEEKDLREAIQWMELLKILAVLFAVGFSMGLQAKFFYHPPVVQTYYEPGK